MEKSKGRLFLLEIVIIILFFSIAAAVCTSMFAKAKTLSRESAELSAAVMLVQESGEIPEGAVFYGADFRPVEDAEEAAYVLKAGASEKDGLLSVHLSLEKKRHGAFRRGYGALWRDP